MRKTLGLSTSEAKQLKKSWLNWFICLVLVIVCQLVSKLYFPIPQIIKLEFSRSAEIMQTNINAISFSPDSSFMILKYNTIVDFGFIAFYTLLAYYSCRIIMAYHNAPVKLWALVLCSITGFFDIIENYFLLKSAFVHKADFSLIYFWAVRIKWLFSLVLVVVIPITIFYGLVKLFRHQKQAA